MPYRHAALAACHDCGLGFDAHELEIGDDGWRCWRCRVARDVNRHGAAALRPSLGGRSAWRALGGFLGGLLLTVPAYLAMLVFCAIMGGAPSHTISELAWIPIPITVVALWICAARSARRSPWLALGLFVSPPLVALAIWGALLYALAGLGG
jgi:hypothetical protein